MRRKNWHEAIRTYMKAYGAPHNSNISIMEIKVSKYKVLEKLMAESIIDMACKY